MKIHRPKISIIIPVYNTEKYLSRCLDSLLNQTFQDWCAICIDDGSTDNSAKILDKYTKNDNRFIVIHKKNAGVSSARNDGVTKANSEYVMFLDSDDILYPTAIEKMYERITADSDLMAVGCYLEYIDKKGEKIGGGLFLGEKTKEGFYKKAENKKLIFMQPTAIYNRELALSVGGYIIDGYPEGRPRYQDYCEDLDLWTRMSDLYTQKKAIIIIPEVLCQYRKAEGLSASSYNMILKMRYVKQNLLRRRAGEKDLTFCEFLENLTKKQIDSIKKDAEAADSLRNGVLLLRKHAIFKGIKLVIRSIRLRPGYIIEKVKKNYLK